MTGFRGAVLLVCGLVLAAPAFAQPQHQGRDQGARRQYMPPPQRYGNPQRERQERPSGTLTREERQELNRDLSQANRELDQQKGGFRRR